MLHIVVIPKPSIRGGQSKYNKDSALFQGAELDMTRVYSKHIKGVCVVSECSSTAIRSVKGTKGFSVLLAANGRLYGVPLLPYGVMEVA